MICVPELARDKQLLALDYALLDGSSNTRTGLAAVAIIVGAIDESIAHLDGFVNGIGSVLARDFPYAKADDGHALYKGFSLVIWTLPGHLIR